jgi:hypothetical protein
MWKTIGKATVALLFLGLLYVPIAAHAAEDMTPPQIGYFNISPAQINTSDEDQTVTITIALWDDLSGVCKSDGVTNCAGRVFLQLTPLISTQEVLFGFERISGDEMSGVYQATAVIPKWSKAGVWSVNYLWFSDMLGNRQILSADDINALFPDSTTTVVNTAELTSVKIDREWTFKSASTAATFPKDTIVTKSDGGSFAFYKMVNQAVSIGDLPNLDILGSPIQAIRMGIPGLNLDFSKPVSITVNVDAKYIGQTLSIQTLEEGDTAWANESSCVVATPAWVNGYQATGGACTFTVSHASYFAVAKVSTPYIITGAKSNSNDVKIWSTSGKLIRKFSAYSSNVLTGGVNVAVGDVNGDNLLEIITSPRNSKPPTIKVFSLQGTNLNYNFNAYDVNYKGGVSIAVADVNNDGKAEIITVPMTKATAEVKVYGLVGGKYFSQVATKFIAYSKSYTGGAALSVGDVNNDGKLEIVTTPTVNAAPKIKVFIPKNGTYVASSLGIAAYDIKFLGGLNSFVGDIDHNGKNEIVTAPNAGLASTIKSIGMGSNGKLKILNPGFLAYPKSFKGGASITTLDTNKDGYDEIITVAGSNGDAIVRVFNRNGKQLGKDFKAYASSADGGTIAAGNF